jgi:hypothetical protein
MTAFNAPHPSELWRVRLRPLVPMLCPVQAFGFSGSVAEMNGRGVGEGLSAVAAFLLVQIVFAVAIAVVVVDFNVSAAIGAVRVFAHVLSKAF